MYCNCNELASATVNNAEIIAKTGSSLDASFVRGEGRILAPLEGPFGRIGFDSSN